MFPLIDGEIKRRKENHLGFESRKTWKERERDGEEEERRQRDCFITSKTEVRQEDSFHFGVHLPEFGLLTQISGWQTPSQLSSNAANLALSSVRPEPPSGSAWRGRGRPGVSQL